MVTLIATILAILGCVNWLIVGIFSFNIVTFIFGVGIFARIIYSIIGIGGLWLVFILIKEKGKLSKI